MAIRRAFLSLATTGFLFGCGSSGGDAGAMSNGGSTSSNGGTTANAGTTGNGGTSAGGGQGQGGNAPVGGGANGGQTQQGGSGGATGGEANVGGAAGADAGAGGAAAGAGGGGNPNATCTDAVLRTDPPQGKEMFKAAAVDADFPFSVHWIGDFGGAGNVGITGMADFDNDGDLDFASGRPGGDEQWWEYCSPDHWVQHTMGSGHNSPGGGNALDVDQDGFVDVIAGDSWYKNPGTPRESAWQRYGIGTAGAEDIAIGDVSGDGKPDALWVVNTIDPEWRTPGADPTMPWPTGEAMPNRQQQGGAIGDVEGDGDNDILVGNQWWYRNAGNGTGLTPVAIDAPFGDASPLATMGDLDGDGDLDFLMCTHFGGNAAWVENLDTMGTMWELHALAQGKAQLHSVFAMDFDNDGDLDAMSIENSGNAYIWENVDGSGPTTEHTVASAAKGHDARVGDVDCDGDLDVAGKPWDGASDHVYLQNMTVENGGTALMQRPAGEVWASTQQRMFCALQLE
jgi:hypothetical protein